MSEQNTGSEIGDYNVRIDGWDDKTNRDKSYKRAADYDTSIVKAGIAELFRRPASFMPIELHVFASPSSGSNADSLPLSVPYPLELQAIDLGCETGATVTGNVLRKAVGGSYASVLDAAETLTPGTVARVAPEDPVTTRMLVLAYGDLVKLNVTAAGGSSTVGGQARLWCQRL